MKTHLGILSVAFVATAFTGSDTEGYKFGQMIYLLKDNVADMISLI